MTNKTNAPVPYTTTSGAQIEIIGVSPFELDSLRNSVPYPPVPTREIKTITGYVEQQPLSADDLRDDDERARWAKYIKDYAAAESERNEKTTNFIFLEGTTYDKDGLEKWVTRRRKWGLPVPDDTLEMEIQYYRGAIIGAKQDIEYIVDVVMEKQGVDEETRAAIRETFRGEAQGDAAASTERAQGGMDVQHTLSGSENSPRVGDDAQRVLPPEPPRPTDDDGIRQRDGGYERLPIEAR